MSVFIMFVAVIAVLFLFINLVFAPHNPVVWFGKSKIWDKQLSNSGDSLKLLIPSIYWKINCGWINHSCKVTGQKMNESEIGNRGLKSGIYNNIAVKEQRVNGNRSGKNFPHLRYTLVDFARNYLTKIPSNQINLTRNYSRGAEGSPPSSLPEAAGGQLQSETSLNLVLWGTNLSSTAKVRFTRFQLSIVKIPIHIQSIMVGLILSDAWVTFDSKTHKNALLGFKQSISKSGYLWFVYNLLSRAPALPRSRLAAPAGHYCSNYPILVTNVRQGNKNFGLQFKTRSMPCITELRNLFYLDNKKIIPINIYDLLTPVALGGGGLIK
jgi:hypothetical protein